MNRDFWTKENTTGFVYWLLFIAMMAFGLYKTGLFFTPTQTYVSAGMALLGFVGAVILLFISRSRWPIWLWFLFAYTAYAWLSTLWAANPYSAVTGAVVITAALSCVVLLPHVNETWRQRVLSALAVSGPLLFLFAMMSLFGWIHYTDAIQLDKNTLEMDSVFQYHNAFAIYELSVAILAIFQALQAKRIWIRGLYILCAATSLAGIVVSYSRMVWLLTPVFLLTTWLLLAYLKRSFEALLAILLVAVTAIAASPMMISTIHKTSLKWFALGAVVLLLGSAFTAFVSTYLPRIGRASIRYGISVGAAVVVLLVAGFFVVHESSHFNSVLARVHSIQFKDESLQGRLWFYSAALHMWRDNPIFGSGYGTWDAKFQAYEQYPYWSTMTHSILMSQLTDFGVFGTIAWIGAIAAVVVQGVRVIRARAESSMIVAASLVAASALLAHSLLDFEMSYPIVLFVFWVLLGLGAGRQESESLASHSRTFQIPYLVISLGGALLGFGAAIGAASVAQALATTNVSQKLNLLGRALATSWYNPQAHLQLADTYSVQAQYAPTQNPNAVQDAWTETQAAARYGKWDPAVMQSAALLAYRLNHIPEAYAMAQQSYRDGRFDIRYPSTMMGIGLWYGVFQYQSNQSLSRSIFQTLLDTYTQLKKNENFVKNLPKDVLPGRTFVVDGPTQAYAATAAYCLGKYPLSLNILRNFSTTNADENTLGLFTMVSMMDSARLKGSPLTNIESQLPYKTAALQQEFGLLSKIDGSKP